MMVEFEPLDPSLLPFVQGDKLCHPKIKFSMLYPCFYSRVNRLLRHLELKSIELESNSTCSECTSNLWTYDQIYDQENPITPVDDEFYYRSVGNFWTAPEMLANPSDVFFHLINSGHKNYRHVMSQKEQDFRNRLSATVNVYRGHNSHLIHGYCWTLNYEIAKQWAYGFPGNNAISCGTLRSEDILAYFNRRGEDEIMTLSERVYAVTTTIVA